MRITPFAAFLVVFGGLVASAVSGAEGDYDFHLQFKTCRMAIGDLSPSADGVRVQPGEPLSMGCRKRAEKISCDILFGSEKGGKPKTESYVAFLDTPPFLYFATQSRGDYVAINTVQHVAVITSRLVDPNRQFVGAKVCQGLYLTEFEKRNIK